MSARSRLIGICVALILATTVGVLAAWPIYQTWWLLVPAIVGLLLGVTIALFGANRLGVLAASGLLFGAFVLTVVPVAVPQSFSQLPAGILRGLLDGVAGIVLGWKQLLTLTLPVGTYQAVMVPAFLVFLLSAFFATLLSLRAGRFAALAAVPLQLPVIFGTVFGSSLVSPTLAVGPLRIAAPRELGLWIAAVAIGACWVWFTAGAWRRAALKRGREPGAKGGGRSLRVVLATATVAVSVLAGIALAPQLTSGPRQVPRDNIEPEIVLREQTSPLVAYRSWKRDDTIDTPVFAVTSTGALPPRLRLAVLDSYDGVDFHVGASEAGRFTRLPSAAPISDPANVTVRVLEGYSGIWVPTAGLGSVPSFAGERAADLTDAFFVNRDTAAAIAVPGGSGTAGLLPGDELAASMSTTPDSLLAGAPSESAAGFDLDSMPELAAWLKAQDQPANAEGLTELIDRLRNRGYLSHAISAEEGERKWLDRVSETYGTRFEASAGGHSIARIEHLFAQLLTQQRLAGEDPTPAMLVAGIGDDEQFATAAALIARAVGFESRVVLGVRLGGETAEVPGVPACAAECTGENLAAWVEVRGESGTWVPMDVTPQLKLSPTTLEEGEQLPEFSTTPEERDAKEIDPPLGMGERSENQDDPTGGERAAWLLPALRVAGLSLAALALLLAPLLFLPLAKRHRARARRQETHPELRALGAWQELVDEAVDAGVEIPAGASRSQIAELIGTDSARWAANTATHAVFSAQGISEQDAEWMWAAVDAEREARNSTLGVWQKLGNRYALKSYGVKFRGKRFTRDETAATLGAVGHTSNHSSSSRK